jgi:hypothetical protein
LSCKAAEADDHLRFTLDLSDQHKCGITKVRNLASVSSTKNLQISHKKY